MNEILIGGRRYVSAKLAGRIYGYCDRHVHNLIRDYDLPHVRRAHGCVLVSQSHLSSVIRERLTHPTKWQQMRMWWLANRGKHLMIRTAPDLVRVLARERVHVSVGYAKLFLKITRGRR